MKKLTLLFLIAISLSACSSNGKTRVKTVETEKDKITNQLEASAQKASNALFELVEIEKEKNGMPNIPVLKEVPRQLNTHIDLDWQGPLAPIAKELAEKAEYKYLELGKKSTVPILVKVSVKDTPIVDILRNIGVQAGSRANLIIDVHNRNIEVHYVEAQKRK